MSFVHLHVHTEYSFMESTIQIHDLVRRAKDLNMPAVAITDHGNMFGALELYREAERKGVKPILGCEIFLENTTDDHSEKKSYPFHLTLLAETNEGYRNLCNLVSNPWVKGLSGRPIVTRDKLREFNEGIIALSGCMFGEVSRAIEKGERATAIMAAERYASIFDKERFHLEIQANGLEVQRKLNSGIINISKELGLPIVATNDCHHLYREDKPAHDALLMMKHGTTVNDAIQKTFTTDQCYFKSRFEMSLYFHDVPEALKNTVAIAERCNVSLITTPPEEWYEQAYTVYPRTRDISGHMAEQARAGLKKRLEELDLNEIAVNNYTDRLEIEIKRIELLGMAPHFVSMMEITQKLRVAELPVGPGFGAAPGNLVAWCLYITDVDPIEHGLHFERFLNREKSRQYRVAISAGSCPEDKFLQTIEKANPRYRAVRCSQFEHNNSEEFYSNLASALGVGKEAFWRVLDNLEPPDRDMCLVWGETSGFSDGQQLSAEVKKVIDIGQKLSFPPKDVSVDPYYVFLVTSTFPPNFATWMDGHGATVAQCKPSDAWTLGLQTLEIFRDDLLNVIQATVAKIQKNGEPTSELITSIPFDDPLTAELFARADTGEILPEYDKSTRDLLVRFKPEGVKELALLLAASSSADLKYGIIVKLIARRSGEEVITFEISRLKPILRDTYGLILFQEQLMSIAHRIAGYTLEEADILRRDLQQKKTAEIEQHRRGFQLGALRNGHNKKSVENLWNQLIEEGSLSGNKSHLLPRAMTIWQAAYLKAHYPEEYDKSSKEINTDHRSIPGTR